MKKTILAAVPLAILALAVPSAVQAKAVTYKAKLAPSAGSAVRGNASLVDGKRRDRLRLRVKGLEAGATYTWSLRRAPAGADACGGDTVASFGYSTIEGRRSVTARSRAKGFSSGSSAYAVVITGAADENVACLELGSKARRKAGRKKQRSGGDDAAGNVDRAAEEGVRGGGEDSGDEESDDEGSDDEGTEDELGEDGWLYGDDDEGPYDESVEDGSEEADPADVAPGPGELTIEG